MNTILIDTQISDITMELALHRGMEWNNHTFRNKMAITLNNRGFNLSPENIRYDSMQPSARLVRSILITLIRNLNAL